MTLSSIFGRFKAKKPDPAAIAAIKAWVLEALESPDGVVLAVNEIDCNDPACPGVETVILIMRPNEKTQAGKIGKRIEDVIEGDVAIALQTPHSNG